MKQNDYFSGNKFVLFHHHTFSKYRKHRNNRYTCTFLCRFLVRFFSVNALLAFLRVTNSNFRTAHCGTKHTTTAKRVIQLPFFLSNLGVLLKFEFILECRRVLYRPIWSSQTRNRSVCEDEPHQGLQLFPWERHYPHCLVPVGSRSRLEYDSH